MKLAFMRFGGGLRPSNDESHQWLMRVADGQEIIVDAKRPRNAKFHRLAFKMMRVMFDATDEDPECFEGWRRDLVILAGYKKAYFFKDGTIRVEPESLSYENMEEEEFHQCMSAINQAFINKYGPLIEYDKLLEIVGFM